MNATAPPREDAPPGSPPEFARRLTLLDVFCLGVNAIIGSGIFLFPGRLAKEAGPSSIFAFLVCGILLITVALCYAELGSIFRRNGGAYVYAREAFGPFIGFGVGWIAWVTAVFSWAAVANAVSAYLGQFHLAFESAVLGKVVACGLILFFGAINYLGIKPGAITVNIFTLAKLLPLGLFVLIGLFYMSGSHFQPLFAVGAGTFGHAVFLALWPLQGFETTPVAAGETKTPQRDIPLAAVGSLLFATLFYTLVQGVAVGVFAGLATAEKKPLADAAMVFLGALGGTLMAVGAVISMTGYNAGNALGSPRYLEPLAEDGFLPRALSRAHPRYGTPGRSIVWTTGIAAVMALFLNFEQLVDISNLAVISQYLSTCLAVLWLRRRAHWNPPFRIPLGPGIPLAGCLVSLWLIKQVKLPELIFAAATVAVGFLAWGAYRYVVERQTP